MRHVFSKLLLLILVCNAQAAANEKASEQDVLAAAKKLAAEDCTPPTDRSGLSIAGCTYDATFSNERWSVLVQTLYQRPDGKPAFTAGGDFLYLFEQDGTLVESTRGM